MTVFAHMVGLLLAVSAGAPASQGVEAVLHLEASGQDEAALALAEKQCQATPPSALPHLEAARLALKLGRDTATIEGHLQAARALAPDNPRIRYLAALAKEGESDDGAARVLYLEALSLRSNYTEARSRLVALGIRAQDWVLAEEQLRALLAAGDRSVGRRLQLAKVLEGAGKSSEAEAVLVSLHHEDPSNAAVTSALADYYQRHNHLKEALALRRAPPAKKLRPLQPSRK
ncbi:MAG: tetratricopeptide repeat protein [Myxococcaceae bacterium]